MNVGIGLALLCAAITQLGFLCKHRGASLAPARRVARAAQERPRPVPLRWFAIGMAIAAGAWILHVAALAMAPLSVVQVALSTGVVMLAVLGERLFGCQVGSRQWVGRDHDRHRPDAARAHAAAHRRDHSAVRRCPR